MSDRFVSVTDEYVKNGGKLLVTGFPGVRDEMGTPVNRIRLRSLGVIPAIKDFEMLLCLY
jgi:hypothetical protein